MALSIMIQGTGSNVGKSVLTAGILRALVRRGYSAAPFKPQNMSNNAAVTADGGEIGRAQALQAHAAGIETSVHMNPVLLKPESETGAQVVVRGKRLTTAKARDYAKLKPDLLADVLESYQILANQFDFIVVEGAGSPAETNLRTGDIANLGFAEAARIPVALIGDIDRGGVIAQVVGTHTVLPPPDRALIKGFAINKFRGDVSLFEEGEATIAELTGWTALGVVPWFDKAGLLPAEDALDIQSAGDGPIKIAVPKLSRIANFDDLDPLKSEPGVQVEMIPAGTPIPGDATLVILAGSKSTIAETQFVKDQGWDIDIAAHIRRGGHVLGLCGGYQMMGKTICDPHQIEGTVREIAGLGLLNIETLMTPEKSLNSVTGMLTANDIPFEGYEIHIGETSGPDCDRAWLTLEGRPEGASSSDGRILGTYVHGIFASDAFRDAFLKRFGHEARSRSYAQSIQTTLDDLATHVETHLDMDKLIEIAQNGV
jgi:adenosylcobyric acid synthase